MHSLGDYLVVFGFFGGTHLGRTLGDATLLIRSDTTGHNQANTTKGTLGKIGCHALEAMRALLQPRVHGSHESAIAQRGKSQIQGGQQMGIECVLGHDLAPVLSSSGSGRIHVRPLSVTRQ